MTPADSFTTFELLDHATDRAGRIVTLCGPDNHASDLSTREEIHDLATQIVILIRRVRNHHGGELS